MFGKTALALGLAALMTAPAWAQQGKGQGRGGFGGGFGMRGGGGGGMLLGNKSVREELKVTEEQGTKLDALSSQLQKERDSKLEGVSSKEERAEKIRELAPAQNAALQKGLNEILKPEQVARFEQIQVQTAGAAAFALPRVQEKLKLTDDQKSKIRAIEEEAGQSVREIFQSAQGDREGAQKKFAELRKETLGKATAVLTDSQKATWKELTGAPFELKVDPNARGGFGGRRRTAE
jgi:Spy/CpxP family protein refolding chaperone